VRRRLKASEAGFETETPLPGRPRTQHVRERSPRWPIAIGVIVIVLCAGGFFAWQSMRSSEARSAAPIAVVPRPPEPEPPPPPAALGAIEIDVEPATATVSVNGQPVPLVKGRGRVELPGGHYELTASAGGYRASEQAVAVTSSEVTALSIKLAKQQPQQRPTKTRPKDVDAVVNPFKKKRPR
jgi:hypothetical protein